MTSAVLVSPVSGFKDISSSSLLPTSFQRVNLFNQLKPSESEYMKFRKLYSSSGKSPTNIAAGDSESRSPAKSVMHSVSDSNQEYQRQTASGRQPQQPTSQSHVPHNDPLSADMESLTINTDFGEFVTAEPAPRPRCNSLHVRTSNTYKHPGVTALQHTRLDDARFPRAGSAENILNQNNPITRLNHSSTISEIPPHYRDALSNDSGYDTPPFGRPHTSPTWPSTRQPLISPPPGSLALDPSGGRPSTSGAVPPTQRLSIDVGHFQPEPDQPELMIAEPLTYPYSGASYSNWGGGDPRYSMPVARSQPSSASEEGVIVYQKERCDRLVQAYDNEQAELASLEEELKQLQVQIEQTQKDNSVDQDTAKEVENLKRENANIRREIEELRRAEAERRATSPVAPPPVPEPRTPATPQQVYPVQPVEEQQWSCPVCTYKNHVLVASCEMCETRNPAYVRGGAS